MKKLILLFALMFSAVSTTGYAVLDPNAVSAYLRWKGGDKSAAQEFLRFPSNVCSSVISAFSGIVIPPLSTTFSQAEADARNRRIIASTVGKLLVVGICQGTVSALLGSVH